MIRQSSHAVREQAAEDILRSVIVGIMIQAVFDLRQLRARGLIHATGFTPTAAVVRLAQPDRWHKYRRVCGYSAASEIEELCRYFSDGWFEKHCQLVNIDNPEVLLAGLMRAPTFGAAEMALAM